MNPGDLDALFEQARSLQKRIEERQAELARRSVTGQAGGGMVTVTASGAQEITAVKIDPSCVDPRDVPLLEDLVRAATNQALAEARALAQKELGSAAGLEGLLPGAPR
jgi:DNA-binding YbaB/EbfC family protein